jgi:molybdopterin-guanine dinucleotide biosynthesis protein B
MTNPKIIGFYGESNTGKTTLIEKIIKRIKSEGLKVATVKITDKEIEIDEEGKDTWRHSQAGSDLIVLSSPIETDFILKEKRDINEIIQNINDIGKYDIILVEGAKSKEIPKIRIGEIQERENTILTYKDDFEEVIKLIKTTS